MYMIQSKKKNKIYLEKKNYLHTNQQLDTHSNNAATFFDHGIYQQTKKYLNQQQWIFWAELMMITYIKGKQGKRQEKIDAGQ